MMASKRDSIACFLKKTITVRGKHNANIFVYYIRDHHYGYIGDVTS